MIDQVFNMDCLSGLRTLPDGFANTCVTSPPYYGLRDYGHDGQIGLEETPEAYVAKLVEVFREVRRVLRDDGTLWLNLGDSYAGSWGNYGGQNRGKGTQRKITNGSKSHQTSYDGLEKWRPPTTNPPGLKPKDLIGIPWRVAFALQADGWYLRQDIIWHKPNPMPESVTDRCTKAHEYIFLLSKSARYYYDVEAVKEAASESSGWARQRENGIDTWKYNDTPERIASTGVNNKGTFGEKGMRNRRSVWTIATQPYSGAHFATYPQELIEPCIKAGCPTDGIVLDPFMGAYTTALVARKLDRHYVGFELNPEYCKIGESRLRKQLGMFQ